MNSKLLNDLKKKICKIIDDYDGYLIQKAIYFVRQGKLILI